MENSKELLQEVRSIFEVNDVEVIMVDKPEFEHEGTIYQLATHRCGKDYHTDIAKDIKEENISKVFLGAAFYMNMPELKAVCFRSCKYE